MSLWQRIRGAWLVLTGRAVAVQFRFERLAPLPYECDWIDTTEWE